MTTISISEDDIHQLLQKKLYESAEYWTCLLLKEKNLDLTQLYKRHLLYAECLFNLQKYKHAMYYYQQGLSYLITLSNYPNSDEERNHIHFQIYQCLYLSSENKEDRAMLQQCLYHLESIPIENHTLEIQIHLAKLYWLTNHYSLAQEYALLVLKEEPLSIEAIHILSSIRDFTGLKDIEVMKIPEDSNSLIQSIKQAELTVFSNPQNSLIQFQQLSDQLLPCPNLYLQIALCYLSLNQLSSFLHWIEMLQSIDRTNYYELYYYLALLISHIKNLSFSTSLTLSISDIPSLLSNTRKLTPFLLPSLLIDCYLSHNQILSSLEQTYWTLINFYPSYSSYLCSLYFTPLSLVLLQFYIDESFQSKALTLATEIQTANPSSFYTNLLLAKVCLKLPNVAWQAEKYFKKCYEIDNKNHEVIYNLASIRYQKGDYNGAIELLKTVIADDVPSEIKTLLCYCYLKNGDSLPYLELLHRCQSTYYFDSFIDLFIMKFLVLLLFLTSLCICNENDEKNAVSLNNNETMELPLEQSVEIEIDGITMLSNKNNNTSFSTDSTISIPILILGTTIIDTTDEEKNAIQMNTLECLAALAPEVHTIVFSSSSLYKERFANRLDFVGDILTNKYGTPIFREMMKYLEDQYEGQYYGYCNGDLLIDSSLIQLLTYIHSQQQQHTFLPHVFLVGRRTNIFAPFPVITSSRQANDHSIHQASRQGVLFQTDAEDYFIFTKHCFDWKEIKPVVIGRPGYDNYLVNYVYYRGDTISFLDVTNSLIVLHQTDNQGVLAGHRPSQDKMYNMKMIKRDWMKGRTQYSTWIIEQYPINFFHTMTRYLEENISYDDLYLQEEIDIMKQVISPSSICIEFAKHAIHGALVSLCKKLYVVVYTSSYLMFELIKRLMNSEMKQNLPSSVEILYGKGSYFQPEFEKHVIGTKEKFKDYIEIVKKKNIHFDVLINNGRCKPQVAYELRPYLKENGILIVHGSYNHYQIIQQYYSLEKEYPKAYLPYKEFDGLSIYKNSKREKNITFPSWW